MQNTSVSQQRSPTVVTLTSHEDWQEAAVVLERLRPKNAAKFISLREQLLSEGYKLIGLKAGGQLVSVASYTISPHAQYGRELLIKDLTTLEREEGKGHASALIKALEQIAKEQGCGRIFVHTLDAVALYTKNGFQDYSTGMIKKNT